VENRLTSMMALAASVNTGEISRRSRLFTQRISYFSFSRTRIAVAYTFQGTIKRVLVVYMQTPHHWQGLTTQRLHNKTWRWTYGRGNANFSKKAQAQMFQLWDLRPILWHLSVSTASLTYEFEHWRKKIRGRNDRNASEKTDKAEGKTGGKKKQIQSK